MRSWYDSITRGQKLFLFGVSIALVFPLGFGLVGLCILIYCQLGSAEPLFSNQFAKQKTRTPNVGDHDYLDWANKEGRWSESASDRHDSV